MRLTNYFQDGRGALLYLRSSCKTQVDQLRLRELNAEWDKLNIMNDIGVNENTITFLATRIRSLNAERPVAKSEDEMGEKFLECIFSCSKHFSEGATIEYNAPSGSRQFEHVVGGDRSNATRLRCS